MRIPADVAASFGYNVDLSTLPEGAGYLLYFHTDEIAARGSHDICETADNYRVISGGSDGSLTQCFVAGWGEFSYSLAPGESGGGLLDLHPDHFEIQVNPEKPPLELTDQYLTAYINPPTGHAANEIDISTIELSVNGSTLGMAEMPMILENVLVVRFELNLTNVSKILGLVAVQVNLTSNINRVRVIATAPPAIPIGLVEMTLTGELTGGEAFEMTDVLRVEME